MTKITVNQLLEMEKRLAERKNELSRLVSSSTQVTVNKYPDGHEVTTKTKYNIVDVDQKIVAINEAIYEIKHKIKESNATTKLDVELVFKDLMAAIKEAP